MEADMNSGLIAMLLFWLVLLILRVPPRRYRLLYDRFWDYVRRQVENSRARMDYEFAKQKDELRIKTHGI
jgi:hypothetical protein